MIPPVHLAAPSDPVGAIALHDLIAWLRQRLVGEHVVRACVLSTEPIGSGDVLLLLGEADQPSGSHDPPRLKARLDAARLAAIRAEHGEDFDAANLIDRTVVLSLRTGLRRRFARGAGVQASVVALLSLGEIPAEAMLDREGTLRRLRADGLPFGPSNWVEPEDLPHVALIASEFGDARRDVEHQLQDLELAGVLRMHRVWVRFEGAGAERTLAEALTQVSALHAEHGLAATILVRGGGPVDAFAALNAYAVARAATAVPNLVVGLGHANTIRTALDEVAARSEPTPTAAAVLVRDLIRRTGARAAAALAAYDAAVEAELVAAGRIALARAVGSFGQALQVLVGTAEQQLRSMDHEVERSLLAIAAAGATDSCGPTADVAMSDPDPSSEVADDALLTDTLALVIVAETGRVITTAADAQATDRILLQFPDGTVCARIEPFPQAHH